jgi:hypothetical protein
MGLVMAIYRTDEQLEEFGRNFCGGSGLKIKPAPML